MNKHFLYLLIISFYVFVFCAGCGETVRGMGKDAHRIGKGTRTIFVSDE